MAGNLSGRALDHSSNAVWPNLSSDALTPQGNGTSDAAGLPVAPLLVNADEVIGTGTSTAPNGAVQHPVRFTLNHILNYWVWPATETAGVGSCSNGGTSIPTESEISQSSPPSSCTFTGAAGEIYRLKSSVPAPSCAATSPQAAIIIAGFRNYGIILADNGDSGGLIGTPDSRWNDTDLQCLTSLTLSDFEPVNVRASWSTTIAPPPATSAAVAVAGNFRAVWPVRPSSPGSEARSPTPLRSGATGFVSIATLPKGGRASPRFQQNAVTIGRGKIQLVDKCVRVIDRDCVAKGVIRSDHHAIGSSQVDEETEGLRIVRERVVMKAAHVIHERMLQLEFSSHQSAVHPSRYIEEAAARVRQYNFELWKFVEGATDDKFSGGGGCLKREAQTIAEISCFGELVGKSRLSSVVIRFFIERMKDEWIAELLASRQEWAIGGFE